MKFLNFLIFALILLGSNFTVNAQECGVIYSPGFEKPDLHFGDPQILEDYQPTEVRYVYITAHIVRTSSGANGISTSNLNTAIAQLNTAFSSSMIEFILSSTDYIDNDNYTTVSISNFPSLAQINVVANTINVYFCPQGDGINGIAYQPGNKCAVTNSAAINGSTLAHEVGHNFGLYHTHGTGIQEYVNGANCTTAGDYLCDTPAEPYRNGSGISGYVNSSCVYTGTFRDPNNELFNPDTHNFMGYSTPACRNSFTSQQIQKKSQTLTTTLSYLINVPVPLANKVSGNIIPHETNKPSTLTVIGGPTVNSGNNANLLDGNSYNIRTNQERFANYLSYGNIKNNNWNGTASEFKLTENYTIRRLENPHRDANFIALNYSKIQVSIEGELMPGKGSASFYDPWYVLSDGSQPGNHWINFTYYYEPTGKQGVTEKGVFLDQPLISGRPFYKVWGGNQLINLGGSIGVRNFYFQNWSAEGDANLQPYGAGNEAGVVFASPGATITSNLKGQGLSNNQNAYLNNSQRKFVRTSDGILHNVYESLNHVYYEVSTNNGATWSIMNNGQSLDNDQGKHPSIDNYGNVVAIVWQEKNGNNYKIKLATYYHYAGQYIQGNLTDVPIEVPALYSADATPVIAWGYNAKAMVIWKGKYNDPFGREYNGLICRNSMLSYNSATWYSETAIPSADINSINPTVSVYKDYQNTLYFQLAWEQFNSQYTRYINYCKVYTNAQNEILTTTVQNISNGSGRIWSFRPSIIALSDGTARVSWIGDLDGWDNTSSVFRNPANSIFYNFGYKVRSTQVTKTNDNSAFFIAWSEANTAANKFTDSYTLSSIKTLNTTGRDIQLSNGATRDNMNVYSFVSASAPYNFTISNSIGSYYSLEKETLYGGLSIGRGGIISKGEAEFYFIASDIILENESISFKDLSDTLRINNVTELNNCLESKTFLINDDSEFTITYAAGFIDSLAAIASLSENDSINFRLELVDNNTGEIISNLKEICFNATNLESITESFIINASGAGNRTVKIRVYASINGEWNYYLVNNYSDDNVLGKDTYKEITLDGAALIKEYALEQNYPNPFNPSTIIRYQIPNDGLVTLKIYDLLGSEVATLVNEQKTIGRYEVNFNAAYLASGVYLYKLTAGSFVQSRKMLLIK